MLDGKEGTNYLTGGDGNDNFVISKSASGIAYIMDFNPSNDIITLKGINGIPDFAHLNISTWGNGTKISLPDNQAIYILNVLPSSFAAESFTILNDETDVITLIANDKSSVAGNDVIWTSEEGGQLLGGDGDDVINGNKGNDYIFGGIGADKLTGGSGNDVFHYENLTDSKQGAYDTIQDFTVGQDRIDLAELFTFGIDSFTDLAITQDTTNNKTIITANDNANPGSTDHFELHLKGIIDLHQEDFIWA